MNKLLKSNHMNLYANLKKLSKRTTKPPLSISSLHSFSKTQDTNEAEPLDPSKPGTRTRNWSSNPEEQLDWWRPGEGNETRVRISHPWPEWVDLMELLLKGGYFDVSKGDPFARNAGLGPKEANWIRTACLNFARDRPGIIRFCSRGDIRVISGSGCPSIDRKVVNSGKRLRAHVGIDEGNVCSSCSFRGDCDRAYVKACENEVGRTVDVMRFLVTYGLSCVFGTSMLENNLLHRNKMVGQSARRLLREVVEYGGKQLDDAINGTPLKNRDGPSPPGEGPIKVPTRPGDWLCPKCDFLNFARNVKCLRCEEFFEERLSQLRANQDHLPLKKGDWICGMCNFLNFAKNTRCLQCKEKPQQRHINPGEWECESCNYINFRRNMICLKCDHRRPKAQSATKTPSHFEHDNGGYSKNRRLEFLLGENEVRGEQSGGLDRIDGSEHKNMWNFVEQDMGVGQLDPYIEYSRFVDFPIAGGKSTLSKDPQKQEQWKLKMLARSKDPVKRKQNDVGSANANTESLLKTKQNDVGSANTTIKNVLKFLDSTDDDELEEWFGNVKEAETRC